MDNDRHSITEGFPSFDEFRQEILQINPEGNLMKAYERLQWYVQNQKVCSDGTPITYRLIMDKYTAHIKAWRYQYGDREAKFIGKEAEQKKKNLWEFIGMKMYENEFISLSSQSERNRYLFGGFSVTYLKKQLDSFKQRFNDAQSHNPI